MAKLLFALPWKELLFDIVGPMLWEAATDPPVAYRGQFMTSKGHLYSIRKIPGFIPKDFSITLQMPGWEIPIVFVREYIFDDELKMARLLAHEGRHVDQYVELGIDGFFIKYAASPRRRRMEADGYSENVISMLNAGEPSRIDFIDDAIDYWMLHYASVIDQGYHIRGSGIPAAYRDLSDFVVKRSAYRPKPYEEVAWAKDSFKDKKAKK